MNADALWQLEEALWTSGRDAARADTAPGAIMISPCPAGNAQADTGWRSIELLDRSIIHRGVVAVLAYRVAAEKPGITIYRTLCASTWVRDGATWRRLSHQQQAVA
jgi:hypothetical protein